MPRVLIVDDQKFVRDALRDLLAAKEPYWELSEAANGYEAVDLVRRTTPEVVVLDIVMDGMGGVAAACDIQAIARKQRSFLSAPITLHSGRGFHHHPSRRYRSVRPKGGHGQVYSYQRSSVF